MFQTEEEPRGCTKAQYKMKKDDLIRMILSLQSHVVYWMNCESYQIIPVESKKTNSGETKPVHCKKIMFLHESLQTLTMVIFVFGPALCHHNDPPGRDERKDEHFQHPHQ